MKPFSKGEANKISKVSLWKRNMGFFGDKYEKFIIKGNKNADLAF